MISIATTFIKSCHILYTHQNSFISFKRVINVLYWGAAISLRMRSVLPRGRTFGRKTQKGAGKNSVGPRKSGSELFIIWFCPKTVIFLAENCNFNWYTLFLYYFALWIFYKPNNISLYEFILWGAELFRQRPNFWPKIVSYNIATTN
jgi:hypothetical protein